MLGVDDDDDGDDVYILLLFPPSVRHTTEKKILFDESQTHIHGISTSSVSTLELVSS